MPPRAPRAEPSNAQQQPFDVQPVHRYAFIQAMMVSSFMKEDDAKALLRRILGTNNDANFSQVLGDVNNDLAFASLRIKTIKYQDDDQKYVGLVNTHADEASKIGTTYTHAEREFFKHVLEYIALLPEDQQDISEMTCLNMVVHHAPSNQAESSNAAAQKNNLSKQNRSEVLRKLVQDGWLKGGRKDGYYVLGARTFLELGDYLLTLEGLPSGKKATWESML